MRQQIDRTWWFKLNALLRRLHVTGMPGFRHAHLVVTEYPKSGGTWLSQMLSGTSGLPYPRSRLPLRRPAIMHGCFLDVGECNRKVVLYRDGRDVMVSYYFHTLMPNALKSSQHVTKLRREFGFADVEDVVRNLPPFMERCFARELYPRFTWAEFVRRWIDDPNVISTRYEWLHADAFASMRALLDALDYAHVSDAHLWDVIEAYRFERVSGRSPGSESVSSFARKGVVGDWRSRFNAESRELFAHHAGDELIRLGYEVDHGWVSRDS